MTPPRIATFDEVQANTTVCWAAVYEDRDGRFDIFAEWRRGEAAPTLAPLAAHVAHVRRLVEGRLAPGEELANVQSFRPPYINASPTRGAPARWLAPRWYCVMPRGAALSWTLEAGGVGH